MKQYKALLSIVLLVILYAFGLIGIASGLNTMSSSPFSLLISPFLLFASHGRFDRRLVIYVFIVAVCGFLLSWLGVTTGNIFGQFFYGNNLGYKLMDVPLIVGIGWLMTSYCTMIIAIKLFSKANLGETSFLTRNAQFVTPLVAAALGVLLQFFVEQVAPVYDFWYWKSQTVPLQNYTAWFAFLYAFNYLFYKLDIDADNKVAIWLYGLQVIFFAGLASIA
jgi:putative membrane protein